MTAPENRAVTVLLTEEHVRRMIEYHLLKEDEISDPVKLNRVVRKSLAPPWGFRTCHGMTGMSGGRGLRDRRFCAGLLYLRLGQYST